MNRFGNIGRHIERNLIAQSFRKVLANLIHSLFDPLGYFHRICSRQHINAKHSGILAVDTTFRVIGRSLQRYTRHVFQPDNRSVGIGTHYNIFKLPYGRQTSLSRNRNGNIQSLYRLLPQYTGCRFTVLILQCIL